ncbi:MAG: rhodanese-like domain-containing protein [Methanotrichaceae archaeon]|nr:rhodanese-like domain-containing protein [Methanotrichaceae archaeon]
MHLKNPHAHRGLGKTINKSRLHYAMSGEQVAPPSTENREFPADQESCTAKDLSHSEARDLIRRRVGAKAEAIRPEQGSLVILDVRASVECSAARIEGSIILDFRSPSFQEQLLVLDPKKAYLVYYRAGRRSTPTVELMRKLGFRELYNLIGGIANWQSEGFEVVKG